MLGYDIIKGPDYLSKKSSGFVLIKIFCRKFILASKNGKQKVWSRARFWGIIFWMEPCFYIFKEKMAKNAVCPKKLIIPKLIQLLMWISQKISTRNYFTQLLTN